MGIVLIMIIAIVCIVHGRNSIEVSNTNPTEVEVHGTICIDAGHGGSDTGAISTDGNVYEKDDNLKLALKVKEHLESLNLSVVMTRSDDSTVDLNERCNIANSNDCDIFVSLHRNSSDNTSANGIEVWVHNSQPPVDVDLANNILSAMQNVGVQSNRGLEFGYRGDSTQNYRVNRLTTMPSCLVETGFISNTTDANMFNTYLDAYAEAIAQAIYNTLEDIALGNVDTSIGKAGQNYSYDRLINHQQ